MILRNLMLEQVQDYLKKEMVQYLDENPECDLKPISCCVTESKVYSTQLISLEKVEYLTDTSHDISKKWMAIADDICDKKGGEVVC